MDELAHSVGDALQPRHFVVRLEDIIRGPLVLFRLSIKPATNLVKLVLVIRLGLL
jgi:hypothetical protein